MPLQGLDDGAREIDAQHSPGNDRLPVRSRCSRESAPTCALEEAAPNWVGVMAEIFVIMPFGVKSIDQGAGMAQVNFDDVYHKFIHPACTAIGWSPRRIDEVSFSGTIGSEIVKYLASSDVVIADLTAENPNVYFELGIRQSLTERPTILIASRGTQLPFDIHDQRVVFYGYPAAPFSETEVAQLSNAIEHANSEGARSPILTRLREFGILANPQDKSDFEADLRQKIARARSLEQLMAIWYWAAEQSPLPAYLLIDLADRVAAHHDWQLAEKIAARAVIEKPTILSSTVDMAGTFAIRVLAVTKRRRHNFVLRSNSTPLIRKHLVCLVVS
jgi:hypothetical protein